LQDAEWRTVVGSAPVAARRRKVEEMRMDVSAVITQSVFAYVMMAVIAVGAAFMIRGVVVVLERIQHRTTIAAAPTPVQIAVTPQPSEDEERARHVAAVAAAVYAVLGAHRLVYIGEVARAPGWTTSGRVIHHTSHLPKRSPERR
jgi:hypothetical protein